MSYTVSRNSLLRVSNIFKGEFLLFIAFERGISLKKFNSYIHDDFFDKGITISEEEYRIAEKIIEEHSLSEPFLIDDISVIIYYLKKMVHYNNQYHNEIKASSINTKKIFLEEMIKAKKLNDERESIIKFLEETKLNGLLRNSILSLKTNQQKISFQSPEFAILFMQSLNEYIHSYVSPWCTPKQVNSLNEQEFIKYSEIMYGVLNKRSVENIKKKTITEYNQHYAKIIYSYIEEIYKSYGSLTSKAEIDEFEISKNQKLIIVGKIFTAAGLMISEEEFKRMNTSYKNFDQYYIKNVGNYLKR